MYYVYRVVIRSGHTYIGVTDNFTRREMRHKWSVRRGKLGQCKVPSTDECIVQSLGTTEHHSDALILEAREIVKDILSNPLNCNKIIGPTNGYGLDDVTREYQDLVALYPWMRNRYY